MGLFFSMKPFFHSKVVSFSVMFVNYDPIQELSVQMSLYVTFNSRTNWL